MLTIIAAVSADGIIGRYGTVPWRLKSDMAHFRSVTTGHPVIMGRKTWESIPPKFRPLPERRNIVLSSQSFSTPGVEVFSSLSGAFVATANEEQVFIIGGGRVYREAMPYAERLLITHVSTIIGEQGDAFFPAIDRTVWNEVSRIQGERTKNDDHDFAIADYSPNLPYIELANVRTLVQLREYRLIRERGHCPFCQENRSLYYDSPVIHNGAHWTLAPSDYPYPGTDRHYLLILKRHAETAGSLTEPEQTEYFSIIRDLERRQAFAGGGVCMRSGDPLRSGASVKHLHAHIICPTKGSEPTKFFIGRGPR